MFIGYFTERPYQDPGSQFYGILGRPFEDLSLSNEIYNPQVAADLFDRYFEEKTYAEEIGFDALMLNEHHSTPFTMGSVMNVEAAILAKITKRAKIVLLGNILPIWDDPLFLAEELAMIDTISRGRLVSGWVRGTGRESITHNARPPYNWERYQEAHELIVKAWTTPGPFRWEGKHFQYRYVNPWARPYQQPHPPIWVPGILSRNTVRWAAAHRYPFIMLASDLEPTQKSYEYYRECAREHGYEAGPQHLGYFIKVHVDETEELALATARKLTQGPSNPFLEGNQGRVRPYLQNLPGMTARDPAELLPVIEVAAARRARGRTPEEEKNFDYIGQGTFEDQLQRRSIIAGTPDTVIQRLRETLEYLRPGSVFLWDGDGAQSHDDLMRCLRLMGAEVLPALREMSKELDLPGPFEVSPETNQPVAAFTQVPA